MKSAQQSKVIYHALHTALGPAFQWGTRVAGRIPPAGMGHHRSHAGGRGPGVVAGGLLDPLTGRRLPPYPESTDGRREHSGRGGEGATGEMAWAPLG